MLVIVAPMLMAYIVYSTGMGIPRGTVNKGELLLPATGITDLPLVARDTGERITLSDKKIWRMIIVGDNHCDKACQNMLYLSRQVHIRLGEKANRVERLYLNIDENYAAEFMAELSADHPRLIQAYVDKEGWKSLFSNTSIADNSLSGHNIYLVDQQGFAMMSYDDKHSGADLLSDTKRLLKYSYED